MTSVQRAESGAFAPTDDDWDVDLDTCDPNLVVVARRKDVDGNP